MGLDLVDAHLQGLVHRRGPFGLKLFEGDAELLLIGVAPLAVLKEQLGLGAERDHAYLIFRIELGHHVVHGAAGVVHLIAEHRAGVIEHQADVEGDALLLVLWQRGGEIDVDHRLGLSTRQNIGVAALDVPVDQHGRVDLRRSAPPTHARDERRRQQHLP